MLITIKCIFGELDASSIEELSKKFISFDFRPAAMLSSCMKLFKNDIIQNGNLHFGNYMGSEDEPFTYKYICMINSMIRLNWGGYYYIKYDNLNRKSLSSTHVCVVTLDWIREMLFIYETLITKFHINDKKYLQNVRWRFINWYTSLAIKGYFRETYLPHNERMELWNTIVKESYIQSSKLSDACGVKKCKYVLLCCKYRLYFILDPLFFFIAKI
jgi:hypothetical protein